MSLPPVIGKRPPPVNERPRCPGCNAPLRPFMFNIWGNTPGNVNIVAREWKGDYQGYGAFCSYKCTDFYANELFKRTGARYVKKEKKT